MADAIKAIPEPWQQFLLSIMFLVLVPLAVIAIDLAVKSEVPDQDLYLTLAIYAVTTGASTRSIAVLGGSILLSCIYFIAYGVAAAKPEACPSIPAGHGVGVYLMIVASVTLLTVCCGIERYNRHVVASERFWDFA